MRENVKDRRGGEREASVPKRRDAEAGETGNIRERGAEGQGKGMGEGKGQVGYPARWESKQWYRTRGEWLTGCGSRTYNGGDE